MATARDKPLVFPSAGAIKGGRLHGWRFHFLAMSAKPRSLVVIARCTPPAWPFPHEVPLTHEHFGSLRRVAGDRARTISVMPLVDAAYRAAGLQVPLSLTSNRMTLRALVKRAHSTTAKGIPL